MKIEGLDVLQKELQDARKALEALHGQIGSISLDADDPQDVKRAIREIEQKVDSKVSRYRNNPLVKEVVGAMKKAYLEEILKRVEQEKAKAGRREKPGN